jgi:hypothetical protein
VLFSPADNKTLYFAGNVLFKTMNGGSSWQVISPDLTRESWDVPGSVGIYTNDDMKKMPRRGVIYTVAPSYKDINTIWCGTDDGLIQLTKDGGKTWKNVTPPEITSWSKVSLMDASHTDVNTAYAAVNRIRCDDMHPHIYRTRDGGKTWKEIVNGLPDDPINAVREDPKQKGLLFAGSERAVYVSFDDGEHWQSLRLNMPATSIRDLVIKDDDLVIGTHGRSFWILDDITPLRQLSNQLASQPVILYKPQTAYRVRWNMHTDTPLPQEEPAGQNPPDGAVIDYYLKEKASEVTLSILDGDEYRINIPGSSRNNERVYIALRTYSSKDTLYKTSDLNIPDYWIRQQQILSTDTGHHRFMIDMKDYPLNLSPSFPIGAIYQNTAPDATAPWLMPGKYYVSLNVDGKSYMQPFEIKMDPRVKIITADLKKQFDLSQQCYYNRRMCIEILGQINAGRIGLQTQLTNGDKQFAEKWGPIDKEAALLENTPQGSTAPSFSRLNNTFASLFNTLQDCDCPPTTQVIVAIAEAQKQLDALTKKWNVLKAKK